MEGPEAVVVLSLTDNEYHHRLERSLDMQCCSALNSMLGASALRSYTFRDVTLQLVLPLLCADQPVVCQVGFEPSVQVLHSTLQGSGHLLVDAPQCHPDESQFQPARYGRDGFFDGEHDRRVCHDPRSSLIWL